MRKQGFAPAVDPQTRLLILGSLPGEASLKARQYYAHPQNAFWRLVGDVIDQNLVPLDYEHRLTAVLAARIGLWDVIATAHRQGSLDTAIRGAESANLLGLIATLPDLRAVAFNGKLAARNGRRVLAAAPRTLTLIDLPSSSPAHARPYVEKQAAWAALKALLTS